jgi:nitrate reductase gamma subunit
MNNKTNKPLPFGIEIFLFLLVLTVLSGSIASEFHNFEIVAKITGLTFGIYTFVGLIIMFIRNRKSRKI